MNEDKTVFRSAVALVVFVCLAIAIVGFTLWQDRVKARPLMVSNKAEVPVALPVKSSHVTAESAATAQEDAAAEVQREKGKAKRTAEFAAAAGTWREAGSSLDWQSAQELYVLGESKSDWADASAEVKKLFCLACASMLRPSESVDYRAVLAGIILTQIDKSYANGREESKLSPEMLVFAISLSEAELHSEVRRVMPSVITAVRDNANVDAGRIITWEILKAEQGDTAWQYHFRFRNDSPEDISAFLQIEWVTEGGDFIDTDTVVLHLAPGASVIDAKRLEASGETHVPRLSITLMPGRKRIDYSLVQAGEP